MQLVDESFDGLVVEWKFTRYCSTSNHHECGHCSGLDSLLSYKSNKMKYHLEPGDPSRGFINNLTFVEIHVN